MERDEDIAAALPQPPPASPARRQAAIGAALDRFDGGAGAAKPAPRPRRRFPAGRPQLGLVLSALAVALVGVPAAWLSLHHPVTEIRTSPSGPASSYASQAAEEAPAAVAIPPSKAEKPADAAKAAPEAEAAAQPGGKAATPAERPAERVTAKANALASAPPPPPPPPPPASPAASAQSPPNIAASEAKDEGQSIVVTGSRVSGAQLLPRREDRFIGAHEDRLLAGRGDWNACTVDDPRRSLAACRGIAPALAAALARAWSGDRDGALALLDPAIAASPRAADLHINRGLLLARQGERERALADLDKAVRYAPASARAYYQRSLVRRSLGDTRRADADLRRAVDLDPAYRELLD